MHLLQVKLYQAMVPMSFALFLPQYSYLFLFFPETPFFIQVIETQPSVNSYISQIFTLSDQQQKNYLVNHLQNFSSFLMKQQLTLSV